MTVINLVLLTFVFMKLLAHRPSMKSVPEYNTTEWKA